MACLELPIYAGKNVGHSRKYLDSIKETDIPQIARELAWACRRDLCATRPERGNDRAHSGVQRGIPHQISCAPGGPSGRSQTGSRSPSRARNGPRPLSSIAITKKFSGLARYLGSRPVSRTGAASPSTDAQPFYRAFERNSCRPQCFDPRAICGGYVATALINKWRVGLSR